MDNIVVMAATPVPIGATRRGDQLSRCDLGERLASTLIRTNQSESAVTLQPNIKKLYIAPDTRRHMTSEHVIVWDLETVPDIAGYAAANGLTGKSDEEIREALGNSFPNTSTIRLSASAHSSLIKSVTVGR